VAVLVVTIAVLFVALGVAVCVAWSRRAKPVPKAMTWDDLRVEDARSREALRDWVYEMGAKLANGASKAAPMPTKAIPSTELRHHIRGMRQSRGWSQPELARRLGCGTSNVYRLETKSSAMEGGTLLNLATVFAEPITVLYEPTPRIEPAPTPAKTKAPTPKKPPTHDALLAAVTAALGDLIEEPPTVGVIDGQTTIDIELWNMASVRYQVPLVGEPIEETISNIVMLSRAASGTNPFEEDSESMGEAQTNQRVTPKKR
jgi:transcriptional regulator with XRE-family HTH domain